jgi:hypothetical protein
MTANSEQPAKLIRQWPTYLAWAAGAALVALGATWLTDHLYGHSPGPLVAQLGDYLSFAAFYFVTQLLFPPILVRLKKLPSTMGVCLAAGNGAGYLVGWLYGLPWGLIDFNGRLLINMLILGAMVGILVGVGWDISKGKAVGFWGLFLVAVGAVTAFFYYTTPVEYRYAADVWEQGLTVLVSYLPAVFAVWWRHRPTEPAAVAADD